MYLPTYLPTHLRLLHHSGGSFISDIVKERSLSFAEVPLQALESSTATQQNRLGTKHRPSFRE